MMVTILDERWILNGEKAVSIQPTFDPSRQRHFVKGGSKWLHGDLEMEPEVYSLAVDRGFRSDAGSVQRL